MYPVGANYGRTFVGLMYVPVCPKYSGYVTEMFEKSL